MADKQTATMADKQTDNITDNIFAEMAEESKETVAEGGEGAEVTSDDFDFDSIPDHVFQQLDTPQGAVQLTPQLLETLNNSSKEAQDNFKFALISQLPSDRAEVMMKNHKEVIMLETEFSAQETERLKAKAQENQTRLAEPETEILKAKKELLEKEIELKKLEQLEHLGHMRTNKRVAPSFPRPPRAPKVAKLSMEGLKITKFYAAKPESGRGLPSLYLTVDHGEEGVKNWKIKDFDDHYGISMIPIADIEGLKSDDFVADESASAHRSGEKWMCVKKALC